MRRLIMWLCLHRMRRKHGTRSHLICSRSSWIHHDLDKWRSISETFLSLFTCQSGHTWSFLVIFGHFWSIHFGLIWTFWTGLTRFCAYLQHIHYYCFKWTVSSCFLKSIFRWNVSPQSPQAKGFTPWCFLICVIKFDDCENDLPQILQLCGFSPEIYG